MFSLYVMLACGPAKISEGSNDTSTSDTGDDWWGDTDDTSDTSDTSVDSLTDFSGEVAVTESEIGILLGDAVPHDLMAPEHQSNTTIPSLTMFAYSPMLVVQLGLAFDEDGTFDCPKITGTLVEDGPQMTDVLIEGGCTDDDGATWGGSMLYNLYGVHYDNLSTTNPSEDCPNSQVTQTFNGGVLFTNTGIDSHVMIGIDGVNAECVEEIFNMGITSSMTMVESGNSTTYNGTGHSVFTDPTFQFVSAMQITTTDQVVDDTVCESEPLSGTNVLSSGDNTLTYTFDGETDCDESPTQMLSINGEEAVEVEGVSCSSLTGSRSGIALLTSIFGFIALRRRF